MSNDFDDDDFEQPDPDPADTGARNQKAAQDRIIRKLEKEREEMAAQLKELQDAARNRSVTDAFREANVKESFAKYFPADQEVSADTVKAWAETEGFIASTPVEDAPKPSPFPSTVGLGTLPGSAKLTEAEWSEINRKDPQRGVALANSGQVDWSDEVLRMSQTTN